MDAIEQHFAALHANPPAPFNPDYDPRAQGWRNQASDSMMQDGFYDNHTREECAAEWRRRYDALRSSA